MTRREVVAWVTVAMLVGFAFGALRPPWWVVGVWLLGVFVASMWLERAARRRRSLPAAGLVYIESRHATSDAAVHVRTVGPEGVQPAGTIIGVALCGAQVVGHDLPSDVVASLRGWVPDPCYGYGRLCPRCVDVARAVLRREEPCR